MRSWQVLMLAVLLATLQGATPALAQVPQLTVGEPTDGQTLSTPNVQVSFQVAGLTIVPSNVPLSEAGQHPEVNRPGEGHVHFMLDLNPVIVWYSADPYTLTDVPPGQHRLMVELVNNDHSSLSPPVVREIQFREGGAVQAAAPELTLSGPDNDAVISDSNLQVTFQVRGLNIVPSNIPLSEAGQHPEVNRPGEGHVHFNLDLNPVTVWYSTDPYTLHDLQPGRHRLMVELVNNDHSSLSPPVVREIQFTRLPTALPNTGSASSGDSQAPLLIAGAGALLALAGHLVRTRARRQITRELVDKPRGGS